MSFKRVTKLAAIALAGTFVFTGCGKINTSATLVTIKNGDASETITLGYGNFVARYNQALMDAYYGSYMGADMWTQDMGSGETMEDSTKGSVLEEMENWYVSTQHASDYGVGLSDSDKKSIEDAAKKFMDSNSSAAVEQMGATEEYVKQFLTDRTYTSRVESAINKEFEKTVSVSDKECEQSTFSYLLFEKGTEDGAAATADAVVDAVEAVENATDSADQAADETAQAKTKADVAAGAANFDEAAALSDVEAQTYSFNPNEDEDSGMDAAVIKAAKGLKEGEMSKVVETDDGFYVIRLDKKHDKDATESKREELKNEKISQNYTDVLDGWKKDITWTVDEKAWEGVKFDERFSNGAATE